MPDDLFNSTHYKFAQVCKEHAQNAGFSTIHADSFYNFDVWRKEMEGQAPKSALNGELLYGNNNGIKNSLDRNYLSDALGTGNLTIKTLSKVTDITYNTENKKYSINIDKLVNNSKGELAYNLIVCDSLPENEDDFIRDLYAINSVIKVRLLK